MVESYWCLFIYYLHLSSIIASGLSLFTIVVSSIGGTYAFIKQKTIDYKLFVVIISFILPGIIIGSIVNKFIKTQQFAIIFPLWVIIIGIFSLVSAKKNLLKFNGQSTTNIIKHNNLLRFISFLAGFASGFFGLGIGGIMGTYLVAVEEISPRKAFSTLIMIMTVTSLIGFIVHLTNTNAYSSVWLLYAIFLFIGAVSGSQIGAYISSTLDLKTLRVYQGWIILFLGFFLFLGNIVKI
ncbi:sulfite exporter TauE/SafE family protein [Desulfurella multipotens]|uniref:sulfite exporter TauE/SafE family protein n=1 Tax=Desulfurella multipotens TaxID=79269 RepID=UPI00316ACBDA